MPKFYKRKFYRSGSRDKYSVEQYAFRGTLAPQAGADPAYQAAFAIVPSNSIQGMRKIKHVTVNVTCDAEHLYWALVYVPGGTTPSLLKIGTTPATGFYEPNQYVMNCGIVDPSSGPIRISSPLSRNLNSGDSIFLVLGNESAINFNGVCKYAVTLQ